MTDTWTRGRVDILRMDTYFVEGQGLTSGNIDTWWQKIWRDRSTWTGGPHVTRDAREELNYFVAGIVVEV